MSQVQYKLFAAIGNATAARRLSADAMNIMHDGQREAVGDSGNAETEITQALPGLWSEKFEIAGHSSEERDTQSWVALKKLVDYAPQNIIVVRFTGKAAPTAYIGRVGIRGFDLTHERGKLVDFKLTADLPTENAIMIGQSIENTWLSAAPYTATANTPSIQLPALAAGYEGVFAIAIGADPTGILGTLPTLAGTLQSDTSNSFPSPATMGTLTGATTSSSLQVFRVDGDVAPTADTFWRFALTLGGTGVSYEIFAAGAISKKLGVA